MQTGRPCGLWSAAKTVQPEGERFVVIGGAGYFLPGCSFSVSQSTPFAPASVASCGTSPSVTRNFDSTALAVSRFVSASRPCLVTVIGRQPAQGFAAAIPREVPTYPFPVDIHLDGLYVRGMPVGDAGVAITAGSDHLPVWVDI